MGKAGMFSSRVLSSAPNEVSGLTGWWDASDSSTLFNATTGGSLVAADGSVARFQDKSGNSRHFTQSTSAQRPIRKAAIKNGLDVLRFDGSLSNLWNTSQFSSVITASAGTVFVVAVASSVTTNSTSASFNAHAFTSIDSSTIGFAGFRSNGTAYSHGYDSATRIASLSYTAGSWGVFTTRHSSSQLTIRLNGGSDASVALESRTLGMLASMTLGVTSQGVPFHGDIGEVITYDVALSDDNRNAVESFLMAKWGI